MMYDVVWRMDFEADSPEDAARQALEVHRDEDSIATVFEVRKQGGLDWHAYDLPEGEGWPITGDYQKRRDVMARCLAYLVNGPEGSEEDGPQLLADLRLAVAKEFEDSSYIDAAVVKNPHGWPGWPQ